MRIFQFTPSAVLSSEYVQQVLDGTGAVLTWLSPLPPHSYFIVSSLTLSELTAVLKTHTRDAWFFLVELRSEQCNGFLPEGFWDYVNDPAQAWTKSLYEKLGIPSHLPPAPPPSLETSRTLALPPPPPSDLEFGLPKREKEYRRHVGHDTWHWCTNCSTYPASGYDSTHRTPTSNLCNECQLKQKTDQCRTSRGS